MGFSQDGVLGGTGDETEADQAVGARWWRLDIHAHSPASFDYGGLPDVKSDAPKPSYREWVQAYIDAGVDGVVITDHNTHEGIDQARTALAEIRTENPGLAPLVIFPGVELTVTGGTHVLAIFDPQTTAEVVFETLTLCKYKGTRGNSDQTADVTVKAAAQIVNELGGLFVPAHADKARGVFGTDAREMAALADSSHVHAVEVIDDNALDRAAGLHWVPVLGSDAHHLTTDTHPDPDLAKAPGTHLTLVKAEQLDLNGLRLALTDPDESIRRSRRGDSDPNDVEHGHIKSLEVRHRGNAETYRFGPWMNCLVGGRGVGKSTVIELLRLALGRTGELPEVVASELTRFSPAAGSEHRWWDDETKISVIYTKDGRSLRVTWLGSEPTQSKVELWDESHWVPQAGRVFERTPVRVFSQKQIYELASKPQSFLAILDDMPQIRRSEWDEEYETLVLRFKAERSKLRQLLADSEKADRLRGELQDVQGRLRHLDEVRASDEYQELEGLEARLVESESVEETVAEIERQTSDQAESLRGVLTDSLNVAEYSSRAGSFIRAADLLGEASRILSDARANWETNPSRERWKLRVADLNTWLDEQVGSSRVVPERTREDRQREAELEAELRTVEDANDRQTRQQAVIDEVLEAVIAKRRELYERRKAFTDSLNASDGSLTKVEVFHQGDTANLGSSLRELMKFPDSFDSAFDQDGIPALLNRNQPKNPRFPDKVSEFKRALIELAEEGISSKTASKFRVDARFYSRLAQADAFDLATDIMLWFPNDLVAVRYRLTDSGNFVPVDRGSPGQRTAALLTVILQMGTDPLILDQPEDDLENKLIRHLAVETLKNIKRNRQLIVSTHNANVVVTSGSENIMVLQHAEALPAIEAEGTLQQSNVKENVCDILEGGEEAIKTRYRRLIGSPG